MVNDYATPSVKGIGYSTASISSFKPDGAHSGLFNELPQDFFHAANNLLPVFNSQFR